MRIQPFAIVCALAATPSWAQTTIDWPTVVIDSSVDGDPASLLGEPDDDPALVVGIKDFVTLGGFSDGVMYDNQQLMEQLDLPAVALNEGDVIGFDLNGINAGFESSIWTFDDGDNNAMHSHVFNQGPAGPLIATSTIPIGTFNDFFGTSHDVPFVGILVFDVESLGVDPTADAFTVRLAGGEQMKGAGAPDMIGLGVIRPNCVADCNADGQLNILDFVCFQSEWQNQTSLGDCDGNGQFNILDFVCFQGLFQAGCP